MSLTSKWTVALKKATEWGTALAVAAGDLIKISDEGFGPGIPTLIKDFNVGDVLSAGAFQGDTDVEGPLNIPVRYEGAERFIAPFMGSDTVTELEAGIAYQHELIFAPSIIGKFFTLVMDKGLGSLGDKLWEYPSVKPNQLELSHDSGKLRAALSCLANRCERVAASQINDGTTMAAATLPAAGLLALFRQCQVWVKEVTGSEDNMAAGDLIKATGVTHSANRNMQGEHVTGSNGEIDEPETDGEPEVKLTISASRYTAALDALLIEAQKVQDDFEPKTYKSTIKWTGPKIPTTAADNRYSIAIDTPAMTLENAPVNAGGPGAKVPVELTFAVQAPQAAPNGTDWAWADSPNKVYRIVIVNGNAASMA